MDDLFHAAATHPLVLLAAGIILVVLLMFNFSRSS